MDAGRLALVPTGVPVRRVLPPTPRGYRGRAMKKRPAPEGVGLPGVVPFDIVNWEGNYILDTDTFLIVIQPR